MGQRAGADDDWLEVVQRIAMLDHADHGLSTDIATHQIGLVRRWASAEAADTGAGDAIALAVSELATNVEHHVGGTVGVDVLSVAGLAVVAVTDEDVSHLPEVRHVAHDAVSGRGLSIVAALSSLWGVVLHPAVKTLWAAVPADPR